MVRKRIVNYRRRNRRMNYNRHYNRRYRKRMQQRGAVSTIYKSPVAGQIFPDRLKCKMYFDHVESTSGPGGVIFDHKLIRGNGLVTPYPGGLGGTANGFAQLSLVYSRFCVYGSSIRVDLMSTSSNISGVLVVYPSSAATNPLSITLASEQPRAKYPRYASIAQRLSCIEKCYASSKVMFGVPAVMVRDAIYCGDTVTDPNQLWYWHVCVGSADETSTMTYFVRVRVTYYVEWFDKFQV